MSKRDKRVDAYITKAPEFAHELLTYMRELIHETVPDVEETLKWNSPSFVYNDALLVTLSAHKEHCRVVFWKGELMKAPDGSDASVESIGKPTKVADLPTKRTLVSFLKQGMKLNDAGVKLTQARAQAKAEAKTPVDLLAALKKNRKALANFEAFAPSHRREYIEWIEEAKREETRERRIAQTVEWVAEAKPRNWKYM